MPRWKMKLESFLSSSSEKKNVADTYLGCFGWAVTWLKTLAQAA